MASLQKLFMPDGQKFFTLFEAVGDNLLAMSNTYYTAICQPEESLAVYTKQLSQMEQANGTITHKLFIELGRNFITPYDREDIHYMAKGMDDIADLTFNTIRQMNSYGLTKPGMTTQYIAGEYKTLIALLVKTLNALDNKRSLSKLEDVCQDMRKIISTCDSRIDAAIYGLFPGEKDVIGIIKWMEHFELLQVLLEKCENVVGTFESIIIKYS